MPNDLVKDLSHTFSEYVASACYQDLPQKVVDVTKMSILDTLGVMLGASGVAPGVKQLVDLVKESGGREESTILGFGGKVPAWMAAFANGAMAHGLDYDDILDRAALHASSSTVPAALALAERLGNVSGRDLIAAVAIGNDLAYRLGLAVNWLPRGWHASPVFGAFSAAAACGKLLGLDRERLIDALGIALCQASGTLELAFGVGSDLRGMYPAFPAKAGVISALLASRGVAGIKSAFEGRAGLFAVYFSGEYDRDILTRDLGSHFEAVNTSFKPWPTCREVHCFIEGVLKLMRQHGVAVCDIAEIMTYEGSLAHACAEPLERRRSPRTTLDAKFSIPFAVAVAATKGAVRIAHFTSRGIEDRETLAMAQKVSCVLHTSFNGAHGVTPGRVVIKTKQGQCFEMTVEFAYGHPENPISQQDLIAKFWDCAAHAARPLSQESLRGAIDLVGHLDQVAEAGEIVRLIG